MTLLTLNIWNLPFLTKEKPVRMRRLIEGLHEMRPDIICLQESWEPRIRLCLLSELSDYQMPEQCLGSRLFGLLDRTGGLVTFVRRSYGVHRAEFIPFKERGFFCLEDVIGKKGFLITEIEIEGRDIVVVNTHLHVRLLGSSRHHQQVRRLQSEHIFSIIHSGYAESPLVLAGDFNFTSDDGEYHDVVSKGYCDVSAPLESNWNQRENPYQWFFLNRFMVRQSKVDYLFTRNIDVSQCSVKTVFNNPPLSDHYGILAEMKTG